MVTLDSCIDVFIKRGLQIVSSIHIWLQIRSDLIYSFIVSNSLGCHLGTDVFTCCLVLCFAKGLYCTVPRLKIGFASQLMNGRFQAHLTFFFSRELSFQTNFYTFLFLFLVDWTLILFKVVYLL